MSDKIIQMENVNKWFGDFQVLKDINLDVESNKKIVAVSYTHLTLPTIYSV